MTPKTKLLLKAFVNAEDVSPDSLRIVHGQSGWIVTAGDRILMRPSGSTSFDTPLQAFRVLAGVGIRSAQIEWDGLDPLIEQ